MRSESLPYSGPRLAPASRYALGEFFLLKRHNIYWISLDEPANPTIISAPSQLCGNGGQSRSNDGLVEERLIKSTYRQGLNMDKTWSIAAKKMQQHRPKNTMPSRFFGTTCCSLSFHDAPGFALTSWCAFSSGILTRRIVRYWDQRKKVGWTPRIQADICTQDHGVF
jgi:hypothetical protein